MLTWRCLRRVLLRTGVEEFVPHSGLIPSSLVSSSGLIVGLMPSGLTLSRLALYIVAIDSSGLVFIWIDSSVFVWIDSSVLSHLD
ncbi:hypothetical protein AVEN_166663-1 [Araneus ventricosus]|uniref:Uncharacterized protein n=1 Tax=Araneus ventricosus TaxID=182803 RepID=A0A4Y2JQA8_ARAVE|nr:hypothetical protein AVEN_166663-1 [Araneus ventricosus]